jgi:Zn-dependent protease/CBS domain-containing protein
MRRFRVGSVLGIPIQVDVTFLLVLPLFAYLIGSQVEQTAGFLNALWDAQIATTAVTAGPTPWLLGAVAALGLFVGVVLHELGHSVVALHYGYVIESITLWVLGGIASFAEMPERWGEELLIAVAGPLVSVLVGAACYLGFSALPPAFDAGRFVLGYLAVINVGLAAFNLLPGFPMDGGRVLRALLARTRSYRRATQLAASVGRVVALLLAVVGILTFNVILVGVAFFVYVGASSEVRQQLVKEAFEGVTVREVMTPAAELDTVSPETTVASLLEEMFRQRHVGYPVVEDGAVVGMVTLANVSDVAPVEREVVTVADVMATDLKTVNAGAEVIDALSRLREDGIGRVLVTDDRGELVGVLTRTDLMRAFTILSRTAPAGAERAPPEREARSTIRLGK